MWLKGKTMRQNATVSFSQAMTTDFLVACRMAQLLPVSKNG
jgi:hypothetical protein